MSGAEPARESARWRLRAGPRPRGAGAAAGPGAGVAAALERLRGVGGTTQELLSVAVASSGHTAAPELFGLLADLAASELLCLVAEDEWGRALAVAVPASGEEVLALRDGDPPPSGRLACDCRLRRCGAGLVIEDALDRIRVELLDTRAVTLLHALTSGRGPELGSLAESAVYELLWRVGMVSAEGQARSGSVGWELADLALHARSRALGRSGPYGGTWERRAALAPLPAVRPQPEGDRFPLAPVDLEAALARDPTLTAVLEARRSERWFGSVPIDAHQLGELLQRAARVRERFQAGAEEVSHRPYPGGGALYELEIYPVIDRCACLDAGLYHYCPSRHELTRVRGRCAAVDGLLDSAARTAGSERPQVLLVLAARFARVFRKYSAIGYSTILKDVGVLYQTLCLVSTAMGLASCPLGGGSARRFAEASGLDPLVEGSVGELIVGSRPDSEPPPPTGRSSY